MANIILPKWNQQLVDCDSYPLEPEDREEGTIESTLSNEFVRGYIGFGDCCFPHSWPSTAQAVDLLAVWCGQPM